MNFKRTKILATVAVAALMGVVFSSSSSNAAAVNPTVNASITTSSAITVADGQDMTFGTWFLIFRNADNFSLHMTTAGVITAVGLGPTPATDSRAINILAAAQVGTVTVQLPAGVSGVVLNMQRTAITDFTDVALTLNNITYATATEGANLALPATTNVPVTAVTGGTPETVSFGADIDVTATPADATHTASFDVSFAY
jgi:hypothetical protein